MNQKALEIDSCKECKIFTNSIFKNLTQEELHEMCGNKSSSFYKKGENIFHANRKAHELFCINTGVVKLVYQDSYNKNQIMRLYSDGDIFGYCSMLKDTPYHYSCIALEDTDICTIPKDIFLRLIQKNEKFTIELFKKIANDLETAEEKLITISQNNIRGRVAQTLLFLEKRYGVDHLNNIKINFSRDEMADFVGTALETIIRTLSDFQKEKLICLDGRKIKIIEHQKLELMRHY